MCLHETGGNNPDMMTMPSLGSLRDASSAAASTTAGAVYRRGWPNAQAYTIFIQAVRHTMPGQGCDGAAMRSNLLPAPPSPHLPAVQAQQHFPPTLFLGLTFGIANNDNTKNNRAKDKRGGGWAMEIKHNT